MADTDSGKSAGDAKDHAEAVNKHTFTKKNKTNKVTKDVTEQKDGTPIQFVNTVDKQAVIIFYPGTVGLRDSNGKDPTFPLGRLGRFLSVDASSNSNVYTVNALSGSEWITKYAVVFIDDVDAPIGPHSMERVGPFSVNDPEIIISP
jgi:hypothetical protein